jgi:hypothetical protein
MTGISSEGYSSPQIPYYLNVYNIVPGELKYKKYSNEK